MTLQKFSSVNAAWRIASCKLYGFIDTTYLGDRDPSELVRSLIKGGVDILQVRAKNKSRTELIELGLKTRLEAKQNGVPVIINDDIDAAFEVDAEGVHLGQEDWNAIKQTNRAKLLSKFEIIGISTHTISQAIQAESDGASYIGVGPVFSTNTKPNISPVGLGFITEVAARINIPFFAIGGITHANVQDVIKAGATRVAVVSAFLQADDPEHDASKLKNFLN